MGLSLPAHPELHPLRDTFLASIGSATKAGSLADPPCKSNGLTDAVQWDNYSLFVHDQCIFLQYVGFSCPGSICRDDLRSAPEGSLPKSPGARPLARYLPEDGRCGAQRRQVRSIIFVSFETYGNRTLVML